MNILSGIKPSGDQLHIGNYFGAVKQWIENVEHDDNNEYFFFIANLHALTSVRDADALRRQSFEITLQYLACGLDPEKVTLYLQSDIPFHTELTWVLSCITPMGLLERAHAYKDARAKNKEIHVGVFTYPILMAVDILLYQAHKVPVGKDQEQHIEIARDIAQKFNHLYGDVFRLPEALVDTSTMTISGLDGRKMSKSYGNTIGLFEPEKDIRKKIMSIPTDSTPIEEPKDPERDTIFHILKHIAPDDVLADTRSKYLAGGYGYGDAKKLLFECFMNYFADVRERYSQLSQDRGYVSAILEKGKESAYIYAEKTMKAVREKVGY